MDMNFSTDASKYITFWSFSSDNLKHKPCFWNSFQPWFQPVVGYMGADVEDRLFRLVDLAHPDLIVENDEVDYDEVMMRPNAKKLDQKI